MRSDLNDSAKVVSTTGFLLRMHMHLIALIAGLICCLAVALDAFQTIILPRRPAGRLRITRAFFILTWTPWRALAPRIGNMKAREQAYSVYGPLSLLLLLFVWALLLLGVCAVLLCYGVAVCGRDARDGGELVRAL
jgi:hypothetical protein